MWRRELRSPAFTVELRKNKQDNRKPVPVQASARLFSKYGILASGRSKCWIAMKRRSDAPTHLTGEGGATAASAWPLALSALATKPEAFISSMNSRR